METPTQSPIASPTPQADPLILPYGQEKRGSQITSDSEAYLTSNEFQSDVGHGLNFALFTQHVFNYHHPFYCLVFCYPEVT